MGLNISVYKCTDLEELKKRQNDLDGRIEDLWRAVGGYENATQLQKDDIFKMAKKMEDRFRRWYEDNVFPLKEVSKIDPDHGFLLGYFYSNYNNSGFNNRMESLGLPDLYGIFCPNRDDNFYIVPDWDKSLVIVNDAITKYQDHLNSPHGKLFVTELMVDDFRAAESARDAFDRFMKEHNEHVNHVFNAYSTSDGNYWMDGIKVKAIIPGKKTTWGQMLHVIYDQDNDGKEDWYLTALKIVRENIEFVCAQPDKDKFYLSWSS